MGKHCDGRSGRPCTFGKGGGRAQVGATHTRCPVCDPDRMAADCASAQGRSNVVRLLKNLSDVPEMLAIAVGALPREHMQKIREAAGVDAGAVTPQPFPDGEHSPSPAPAAADQDGAAPAALRNRKGYG